MLEFKILQENEKGRIGKLRARNIEIETPTFLPVATKACIKTITPDEAKKLGYNAIIVNALHIYRRAMDVVTKVGIHKFMKWHGIIFSDSGGFQSIKNFPAKINNEGIIFRMPDGKEEIFTPKKCMEVQDRMGSDFVFALDDCPSYPYSKKRVEKAVERTIKWAIDCQGKNRFAIIQGGIYEDLRKYCAKKLASLDFFGFAIGGLCIGEEKQEMIKMVEITAKNLPFNRPRHLMGVGSPDDIAKCVKYGIDIFDSAFPTRNARHGTIFTSRGKINLGKKKVKGDTIDDECSCYTCKNFSLDYLNYLFKEKEPLAMRLATIHNLHFMNKFMEKLREEIKNA